MGTTNCLLPIMQSMKNKTRDTAVFLGNKSSKKNLQRQNVFLYHSDGFKIKQRAEMKVNSGKNAVGP